MSSPEEYQTIVLFGDNLKDNEIIKNDHIKEENPVEPLIPVKAIALNPEIIKPEMLGNDKVLNDKELDDLFKTMSTEITNTNRSVKIGFIGVLSTIAFMIIYPFIKNR